jgi:hypothetical protein
MNLPLIRTVRLFYLLLLLPVFMHTAAAQETSKIKLESLDKLAAKASEVVQKEEKTQGGDGTVYVRCFEFKQAGEYKEADLGEIHSQLQAPGWSRLMKVVDKEGDPNEHETVEIYVFGKVEGSDAYNGMTIIAAEAKELAVVNIVGRSSLDEVMKQANKIQSAK